MSEKINETINNEEEVSLVFIRAPSEQSGGMGLDPSGDLLEELRQEMNGEELGLDPGKSLNRRFLSAIRATMMKMRAEGLFMVTESEVIIQIMTGK